MALNLIPDAPAAQLIPVTGIIFIWVHYSSQFNEKYVLPENDVLMKTMPFSYLQIWIAKFSFEMLFALFLALVTPLFLWTAGVNAATIFSILLILLLFAVFILTIMTTLRISFYEQPRLAGYAYHFLVIFSAVMIMNFYLVGPIVILGLLFFLIIRGYLQFSK